MNKLFLLLCNILFFGLVSCNGTVKSNETIRAVEKTDSCNKDSKNGYEVYIPQRDNPSDKLPLLLIIDAHGSGKFALEKFKQGASRYGVALIASNAIKNGYADYEGAIQTLMEDVHKKYPIGETVFMTGFSGGARMVLGYALSHPVNGLILCGALAGADQINTLHCPVISISGMDDFNFMETAQYLFKEESTPRNLKIELTNASHSWPDSLLLGNAMGFLHLSSQAEDIPALTKSQLTLYCQQQQKRINSLKQKGEYLKAVQVAHNMSYTKPFRSEKTFTSIYNELKNLPEYISQLNRLEKCLNLEMSGRQGYIDAFKTKEIAWWKNEINTTEEKIKSEQDPYTRDMYRRITGFWGIASYTFCKQAIAGHDAETLNKVLSIYSMLEPENPDMLYFSSFPYFWKGNTEDTLTMLRKALKAGFSDRSQLKKDFPESIVSKL